MTGIRQVPVPPAGCRPLQVEGAVVFLPADCPPFRPDRDGIFHSVFRWIAGDSRFDRSRAVPNTTPD